MASESIAHEAEGVMGYWLRAHSSILCRQCWLFFFSQATSKALSCSPEKNCLTCVSMSFKTPWPTKDSQVPESKLSGFPKYLTATGYTHALSRSHTFTLQLLVGNIEYCIYFSLLSSGFAYRMPRYVIITTCTCDYWKFSLLTLYLPLLLTYTYTLLSMFQEKAPQKQNVLKSQGKVSTTSRTVKR